MRTTPVAFVPKRPLGDLQPWRYFGADRPTYQRWVPHICGICCLKMVGDTLGRTRDLSLHELTQMCVQREGFRVISDDRIDGVFHHPLAALGNDLGIPCRVVGGLTVDQTVEVVTRSGFALLSVSLARLDDGHRGGHIVLVHGYAPDTDELVLHDCAAALGQPGNDVRVGRAALARMANNKGLVVAPAEGSAGLDHPANRR